VPMRTCIGCRRVTACANLVRVTREAGGTLCLVPNRPGRGAWLCVGEVPGVPRLACLEQAANRQAFGRAFRAPVHAEDVEVLRGTVQERARIETGAAAGGVE
jgi:predicted RNA-binding protein YlxR (DUF448 family)